MAYYEVMTNRCEHPEIFRIHAEDSDGSCTNLRDAKMWYRRELEEWYENEIYYLKTLKSADIPFA